VDKALSPWALQQWHCGVSLGASAGQPATSADPGGTRQLPFPFVHDEARCDCGYQPIFSAGGAFRATLEWLKTQEL